MAAAIRIKEQNNPSSFIFGEASVILSLLLFTVTSNTLFTSISPLILFTNSSHLALLHLQTNSVSSNLVSSDFSFSLHTDWLAEWMDVVLFYCFFSLSQRLNQWQSPLCNLLWLLNLPWSLLMKIFQPLLSQCEYRFSLNYTASFTVLFSATFSNSLSVST